MTEPEELPEELNEKLLEILAEEGLGLVWLCIKKARLVIKRRNLKEGISLYVKSCFEKHNERRVLSMCKTTQLLDIFVPMSVVAAEQWNQFDGFNNDGSLPTGRDVTQTGRNNSKLSGFDVVNEQARLTGISALRKKWYTGQQIEANGEHCLKLARSPTCLPSEVIARVVLDNMTLVVVHSGDD